MADINRDLTYDDLTTLLTMMTGDEKHSFSATSTLDVLWTLYDRVLNVDPDFPDKSDRDRFLLSKGHGLPIAVGVANALRAKGLGEPHVFCLVGDAELDEGSNHEAISVAARLCLNRLTAIENALTTPHPDAPRVVVASVEPKE